MQEKGLPDAKRATAGNPSYPYKGVAAHDMDFLAVLA